MGVWIINLFGVFVFSLLAYLIESALEAYANVPIIYTYFTILFIGFVPLVFVLLGLNFNSSLYENFRINSTNIIADDIVGLVMNLFYFKIFGKPF